MANEFDKFDNGNAFDKFDGQSHDLYSTNPTEGMSGTDKFLAGAGKGMTDIVRGAGQILGLEDQQSVDESKSRDAALMQTGAGMAGNVVGQTAATLPAMLIPGANTVAGGAAIGAATGALQPTSGDESRTKNVLEGGAGGTIGSAVVNGLGRALNPQTSAAVKKIMDSGVTPTPGQILGGAWAKLESAAQSIPFVGDGIKNAKTRAVHEFNSSVINKALSPIGETVKEIGHEGMVRARDAVSNAYDAAIDLVPIVDFGPKGAGTAVAKAGETAPGSFWSTIDNIKEMGKTLKPEHQKQLETIIKNDLIDKVTPAGTLSGESTKQVQSEFARNARNFRKGNPGRDDLQIADALDAVSSAIKGKVAEANPIAAEMIRKADASHAMLLRVEEAAKAGGAVEGIFTPAQFGNAVKKLDPSLRKKAVGQGKALMQDMATNARTVLGETLPNSGTADRLMSSELLMGGLGTGALLGHPAPLAGALVARGAYTEPAQKAIAAILARRPDAVRKAGDMVRLAAPAASAAAGRAAIPVGNGALLGLQGMLDANQ